MIASIHPTAVVDAGAKLGNGTKVWHWTHVSATATIGRDCVLGQNVYIGERVRIGSKVKIQNNVSVYEGVTLEDEVFCGPSMVFTNVIEPRGGLNKKNEFRKTLVRKGATLGANSTIICGNTIGAHAFVGAGAVVSRSVPDYALVLGVPAVIVGWVSEFGKRLSLPVEGDGEARCPVTSDIYIKVGSAVHRASSK